jgi:hypothetical protein
MQHNIDGVNSGVYVVRAKIGNCLKVRFGSITEVEQLIRPAAALRPEPAIQFGIYEFRD